MADENGQTIPSEKLESWRNSNPLEPSEGSLTSEANEELENLTIQELLQRQKTTLNVQKRLGEKVVSMIDTQAKNSGLPGFGDEDFQKDYVEIGMVWVESMAGRPDQREKILEFLKKAPGYTFGILSLGILGRNGIAGFTSDNSDSKKDSE